MSLIKVLKEFELQEVRNKIILGNNLEVMSYLPRSKFQAIITSPPYNLHGDFHTSRKKKGDLSSTRVTYGDYDGYSDSLPEGDYQQNQLNFLEEAYWLLKEEGVLFYIHKNRKINWEEISPLRWIRKSRWRVYQTITLDYRSTANVDKNRCFPVSELIFVLVKSKNARLNNRQCWTDVWNDLKKRTRKITGHPATFPPELVRRCLLLATEPGDYVLDPHGGIGTTAIECKKLQRFFVLIEISLNYARKSSWSLQQKCGLDKFVVKKSSNKN